MGIALWFDVIIVAIVIILALKGLFSGFVRETCSMLGIVGGVLIASRYNVAFGELINSVLKLESLTLVNLIGFMAILALIWISALVVAELLVRFATFIKLGMFDKILGVGVAGAKIFLVLSIIFFTFSKINFLSNFTAKLDSNSAIYPYMIVIGDFIVKTDFNDLASLEGSLNNALSSMDGLKDKSIQTLSENAKKLNINNYKPNSEDLEKKVDALKAKLDDGDSVVVF